MHVFKFKHIILHKMLAYVTIQLTFTLFKFSANNLTNIFIKINL